MCSTFDCASKSEADDNDSEDRMEVENDSNSQHDNWGQPLENVEALNDESLTPLFCGSNISRLDSTLMIMNVCQTHKISNACISELLHLMSKVILPSLNSLPNIESIATSMLSRLGLWYDAIDACKNGCILFRHEYVDMEACPMCNECRYKRIGQSRVPNKVLRHFPLVPRLRRMFSTSKLASLMTWHSENMSQDGKMRGPFDFAQWEHVRGRHADFEADSRNLHLGMCTDGLNPHLQE